MNIYMGLQGIFSLKLLIAKATLVHSDFRVRQLVSFQCRNVGKIHSTFEAFKLIFHPIQFVIKLIWSQTTIIRIQMFKNLQKPTPKDAQPQKSVEPQKLQSSQPDKEDEKVKLPSFEPRNIAKDRLYVTFCGVIEYGQVNEEEELSVMFKIWAGEDWKLVNGEDTGLSQVGSCYLSSNKKINWNMPFEVTFETTVITGWPQIVLELHGRDFFGRNVIKAYGCCHMPSSEGQHQRIVGLFLPKPISLITGFFGYLNGCIAEFKEAEKVLATGDGREVTRVKTVGFAKIKVQTVKYNFGLFGYS